MRLAALLASLVLTAGPAGAHGGVAIQPDALWQAWSFDPVVLPPLLIAHWAYGRGVLRLWRRAGDHSAIGRLQVLSFVVGEVVLVLALVSPLDQLGGTLLSAHMAQHALLVGVAPPLLLMGLPAPAFAWALPASPRKQLFSSRFWRTLMRLTSALSRPGRAATLHAIALWFWHAPVAFDAALESEWIHALEHACFFGTALLFWRALVSVRSANQSARAIGSAFFTLVHSGLLGALITLSTRPVYAWYGSRPELWGLAAIEDQQFAGLLMWVPMGIVYFGASLALAKQLLAPDARRPQHSGRAVRSPPKRRHSHQT